MAVEELQINLGKVEQRHDEELKELHEVHISDIRDILKRLEHHTDDMNNMKRDQALLRQDVSFIRTTVTKIADSLLNK